MSTLYDGLGLRTRPANPSRYATPESLERLGRFRQMAEHSIAAPFKGLTSDGQVMPDLFPLTSTGRSTEPIRRAALAFLDSLTSEQREGLLHDISSDSWRCWSNIHPYVMRHGLLLEDLAEPQRDAALGILRETLSATGFQTARDIMRLNYTIGELTGSWTEYGEFVYFLSLFGEPSRAEPWGWQLDGHHLVINCFVLEDQVVVTPMFMGSEPVTAETGVFRGTSVLQPERTLGLELIDALTPEQRKKVVLHESILSDALPAERGHGPEGRVRGGAFRDNEVVPYEGIRVDELTAGQRERLLRLASIYTCRLRPDHADVWLDSVSGHLDETYFAWMGGTGDNDVFYYRIHSPVVLVEFDHQIGIAFDNDEPSRNHIHTVVRTPNGNDYGKDYLRQHHARFAHVGGRHIARVS